MQKIIFYWKEIKSSFWFVPILLILASVVLALTVIYIDNTFTIKEPKGFIKFLFVGSVESARSILVTISGAMIGVAGTVFSMTLVALTLASNKFGSRLLRNFMHERLNQVVLGSYISTFVYCLLVLNAVIDIDKSAFIPSLSVLIAIVIAIANIILLIIFIHHIAVSIQSDTVISQISKRLNTTMDDLFSVEVGESVLNLKEPIFKEIVSEFQYGFECLSSEGGYVQYIGYEDLISHAKQQNGFIKVDVGPGDFILKGQSLASMYTNEKQEDADLKNIENQVVIGNNRTPHQDIEFSINQIVEVAGRALSPGINDPFTAMSCINNLTSILAKASSLEFPSSYRLDEDQKVRLLIKSLDFERLMDTAFSQIRHFAREIPSVSFKLMESMVSLMNYAQNDEQKRLITMQAEVICQAAGNNFKLEMDSKKIKNLYELHFIDQSL